MDWDKNQLEAAIIDARRCSDVQALEAAILRYLYTPGDNVVCTVRRPPKDEKPLTIPKFLAQIIAPIAGERTCYRGLEKLLERGHFVYLDEISLQINPQFGTKGGKSVSYEGLPLVYTDDEVKFLRSLDIVRRETWAIRGKDRIYTGKDDEMSPAMRKRFDELERQNSEISKQNETMMKKHDETLSLLREILSGQATREKIVSHLRLVESDE